MGEITSYHEGINSFPIFGPFGLRIVWPFFGLTLFVTPGMVLPIIILLVFMLVHQFSLLAQLEISFFRIR
jgi:hypothetical protein